MGHLPRFIVNIWVQEAVQNCSPLGIHQSAPRFSFPRKTIWMFGNASLTGQIFTAWSQLYRVDVHSAADYLLIRSIVVPSPSTLEISPDGNTLAAGTSAAHVLFFRYRHIRQNE
jgi:hypothetical protein